MAAWAFCFGNVGIAIGNSVVPVSEEEWKHVMAVSLKVYFRAANMTSIQAPTQA
jgi:hypothetical protein